jgi:hypothetical protein
VNVFEDVYSGLRRLVDDEDAMLNQLKAEEDLDEENVSL